MPDKKSKHREERKRKRSRSKDGTEKEEKRGRNEKRERKEKIGREEKKEREMKEEKVMKDKNEGGLGQERLSLSVEETNKMRAKLGLKPLQMDDKKEDGVTKMEQTDVHLPAINMADKRKTAELKEKLAQMKEKRKNEAKFAKIKPLACDDDEEDGDVESVMNWVAKSRKIEKKKKILDESEKLSKEFGIDKIVKTELGMNNSQNYSSKDLRGLRIEHDSDRFKEGRDVVLTLKDKGVLDEKEDILVNVNMVDDEAAEVNIENSKKKLDYNPYEDLEYDEHGNPREDTILSKYDDEIRGTRLKKNFLIGEQPSSSNVNHPSNSNKHMQSLMLSKPTLVSEYFTTEEVEQSGKARKVKAKKIRKKTKLSADDLIESQQNRQGSSSKSEAGVKGEFKSEVNEEEDWDPYKNLSGVVVEDDGAALELEMSIKKGSRFNSIKKAIEIKQEPDDADMMVMNECDYKLNGIFLNSTAEYCRSLGEVIMVSDVPTTNPTMEEDGGDEDEDGKGEDGLKGWQSVDMEEGEVAVKEEDSHVLDEEPILNKGVGAALMLASKKGYLNSGNSKNASARVNSNLEAKNYSIEDKRVEDDDKYRSKRDRYSNSGPIVAFKEKDGYDPDIKLEYIDDLGREMSKKEAFRYLSHQFHGKGSGLKKVEKRMKKEKEDVLNRTITSETPLTTVQMLQEKQKHSKLPYVILGASKAKN